MIGLFPWAVIQQSAIRISFLSTLDTLLQFIVPGLLFIGSLPPHMRESIVNLPIERVESLLLLIRGEKVIMDRELARFSVLSTSAQSYLRNLWICFIAGGNCEVSVRRARVEQLRVALR